MHPEDAENENNCDFDRTRECPLSLISRKTFNSLSDYRRVSVEVSDFCRSKNLSKGGHFSVFRNHFFKEILS